MSLASDLGVHGVAQGGELASRAEPVLADGGVEALVALLADWLLGEARVYLGVSLHLGVDVGRAPVHPGARVGGLQGGVHRAARTRESHAPATPTWGRSHVAETSVSVSQTFSEMSLPS